MKMRPLWKNQFSTNFLALLAGPATTKSVVAVTFLKRCVSVRLLKASQWPFNCLHLAVNHISPWFLIIWRLSQVPPTCVFCWPSLIVKDSDGKSNVFGPEFQLVSLVWQGGTPFSINLWSVKNWMAFMMKFWEKNRVSHVQFHTQIWRTKRPHRSRHRCSLVEGRAWLDFHR